MNRPKQTRAMLEIKPIGPVPARIGPNHHKQFRQPKGYYSQSVGAKHDHSLRRSARKSARMEAIANETAYNG